MFALILTFACSGCGPGAALTIGPVTQVQCEAILKDMRKVDATERNAPAYMACLSEELTSAAVNGNGCTPYSTVYFPSGAHQREWWCRAPGSP